MIVIGEAERHIGNVVGNGHCVRFVQIVGPVPHTSQWQRGIRARGAELPEGTVIATFGDDGTYGNHTDGRSHAAILVREERDGLRVIDQWQGQPVHERLIRFRNGEGKAANDGDSFYTVEARGV